MDITWTTQSRNLTELNGFDKNPRKVSQKKLEELSSNLKKYGVASDITVNLDNTVIGGHQRLKVLAQLGVAKIDVKVPSRQLSPVESRNLNVLLNKNAGEFDFEMLSKDFNFDELKDLGFDSKELDSFGIHKEEIKEDEFEKSAPIEPVTKLGDIYTFGEHRLICGDSTTSQAVEQLMQGEKADIVVTDPPYGVNYSEKNKMLNKFDNGKRIQKAIGNDTIKDYREFYTSFLKLIPLNRYNTIYTFISDQKLHNLRLAFDDTKIQFSDYLIWVKNNHVLGRKDYSSKHEIVMYGWLGQHKFHSSEYRTTTLNYDKPQKSDLHPTMKPIKLLAQLIEDGSVSGSIVYDAFGGSGSTLIAAEQLGRKCRMLELDPGYCDVILQRWCDFKASLGQVAKVFRNDAECTTDFVKNQL